MRSSLQVAGLVGLVALGVVVLRARRHSPEAPPVPSAVAPRASASAGPPQRPVEAFRFVAPPRRRGPELVPVAGFDGASAVVTSIPGESREMRRKRLAEVAMARDAIRGRYPPWCRPAVEAGDRFAPAGIERVVKSGEGDAPVLRLTQSAEFLGPGEVATLGVEAELGGRPAPVTITRADLMAAGDAEHHVLSAVEFRDDGKPPDETPGDGLTTGAVTLPREPAAERAFQVVLGLSIDGVTQELAFRLARRSDAGRFTGRVTDRLDHGDVAFDLGMDAKRPGTWAVTGRLYDAAGRGMAVLTAAAELHGGTGTVTLRAFGKLLRDEGVPGPWVLRDVSAFLVGDEGAAIGPDGAQHRTRAYALTDLGNDPWSKIEKKAPPPGP